MLKEILEELVRLGVSEIVKELDSKRLPVADAAKYLWGQDFTARNLMTSSPEQIVSFANTLMLPAAIRPKFTATKVCLVMEVNGELMATSEGGGWEPRYPLRQATADSAEYLYREIGAHCELAERSPAQIREVASLHQSRCCQHHADAAMYVFMRGVWSQGLILSASYDEICAEAQRLADAEKKATSIELTPAEVQSGLDRVHWAELLIRQLPEDHEGRNSWLMNFAKK